MLKKIALDGMSFAPMQWLRPFAGSALLLPYYHMVSDEHLPHVSTIYRFRSTAEFVADVEYLVRNFEPVTLQDIVDALDGAKALPSACFHLTFDDGFREMHDIVAPILQRFGVPATFFVNTAFLDGQGLAHHNAIGVLLDHLERDRAGSTARSEIERLLPQISKEHSLKTRMLSVKYAQHSLVTTLAQILDCDLDQYVRAVRPYLSSSEVGSLQRSGFTIGAHSHDHPLYADLSLDEQLDQTRTCMSLLREKCQIAPKSFAFPHNDTGVGAEFFASVFSSGLLDVSFGTSGIVPHFHPRNLERISMEKTAASAQRIVSRQYARAALRRLRR